MYISRRQRGTPQCHNTVTLLENLSGNPEIRLLTFSNRSQFCGEMTLNKCAHEIWINASYLCKQYSDVWC